MIKYTVLFEKTDTGYTAYVPDLPGCAARGETETIVEELIYEAIQFHLEGLKNEGLQIPEAVTESKL